MYKNGERAMAWVAKIDEVKAIEKADNIVAYRVGGWWVVDKKDAYSIGDLAIYVSIDSWVPNEIAPFLSKGSEPREYNGVLGERLRTVKLRGQVSQGLLLPLTVMNPRIDELNEYLNDAEGFDCSEWLNIQKWEAPIPAQLAGEVRGSFPGFIPKTDQERLQNLVLEYAEWQNADEEWEVTEKLDGSSMTVYVQGTESGVCSRNLNLIETNDNSLWKTAKRNQLIEKVQNTGRNLALQGELIGEGIQGNPYKIVGQEFYLFDIYDIDQGEYLHPNERQLLAQELDILHVPFLGFHRLNRNVEDQLNFAEGKSLLRSETEREGVVFKNTQEPVSFKVISNKFLLKTKG